jgi:hypothetical protein
VPSRHKLVVAYERALSSGELDLISLDVTPSGFAAHIDTVLSGLPTADGMFDISPDGERLVHSPGSVETTLSAIDPRPTKEGRLAAKQVLSSTTLLRGVISPTGDRIIVVREIPTNDGRVSDFSILPRDGGAESHLARGIRNLLDFNWSPDGATVMYLHGIGANKVRLMASDTVRGRPREIVTLEQSDAIAFLPLPDGAVCVIPPERRSLSIIRRRGKSDLTWPAPDWISSIKSVSLSPDAKSLAVLAWDRPGDSVVVTTVDIENGHFSPPMMLGGEWLGGITWLEDGNIMFDVRELRGAYALFTTRPGGVPRRRGALPYTQEWSSVSKDGKHMAGFNFTMRTDVYMIRNFGKMLR